MILFSREGKYVTATNMFWFWIAMLSAVVSAVMNFGTLKEFGQIPLGVIMALPYIGCVVFSCLFLFTGKRSWCFIACGCGIICTVLPFVIQCVNLEDDSYIKPAVGGLMTVISTIWALIGSKKLLQEHDTTLKDCLALKHKPSRVWVIVLYCVALAGLALAIAAVAGGAIPR